MSKQSELVGLARTTNLDEVNAAYSAGALSNRNLIINGAMQVAQRGTSVAGLTSANEGYKTVDRLNHVLEATSELVITSEQSTDAPDGFSKSVKLTVTTPETAIGSTERVQVDYKLEGQNVQSIGAGTTSAQQLTVSFWVKSSVTGTYSTYIYGYGGNRIESHTYTIDVAATWEQKTITFSADTTTANYADTNVAGLELGFLLSAGSGFKGNPATTWEAYSMTNLADGHTADVAATSGATWQITGVQLEVGDTATPFEHRSFGQELTLCQRYYERVGNWSNNSRYYAYPVYRTRVNSLGFPVHYRVQKRVNPSVTTYSSGLETTGVFTQINGGSNLDILYGPDGDENGLYRSQHATDPVSGLGYGLKIEADAEL